MNEERSFGCWAGNSKGNPENKNNCIEEIFGNSGFDSWVPHQCRRKRGFGENGLYCKQHAKKHIVIAAEQKE